MKNILRSAMLVGVTLVGMAYAVPISSYTWNEPTNYENGEVIDPTDILTYTLYCGNSSGGPYFAAFDVGTGSSANNVDVANCVNGVAGTYYFVLTARSTLYGTESNFSNEVSRTYTAADLGKVPNAPILLTVQ